MRRTFISTVTCSAATRDCDKHSLNMQCNEALLPRNRSLWNFSGNRRSTYFQKRMSNASQMIPKSMIMNGLRWFSIGRGRSLLGTSFILIAFRFPLSTNVRGERGEKALSSLKPNDEICETLCKSAEGGFQMFSKNYGSFTCKQTLPSEGIY